jgi:acetoin utilization deacetylase AcuC-like enzyme
MSTAVVYDPDYLKHRTVSHPERGAHPECAQRVAAIATELKATAALAPDLKWLKPRFATAADILRCHEETHYDFVVQTCEELADEELGFLDPDTAISRESLDVAALAAGGVLTAIDAVMAGDAQNAFVIARPPGHHATALQPMGFCLFNNVAIGARYAQAHHNLERILIVDWDVHHGNGTQDIFYNDSSVFFLSLHQFPYYPGSGRDTETGEGHGKGYTINVPLPAGVAVADYREAFATALQQITTKLHPDLILISAGFDSHREDPLGHFLLTEKDFIWMTQQLKDLAAKYGHQRVVSVLEGGYNLKRLGSIARAHVEALVAPLN